MTELSWKDRARLYLYSTPHIVGAGAALVGLGLYFGGIIESGWWAIVAGLYLGGVLVAPRNDLAAQIVKAEFDEHNLRERLAELIAASRKRVPAEAAELLEAIRGHAELLLPKLKELTESGALASNVRHDVVQSLTRYLPDTLAGYLRLPPAYSKLHTAENGKTPQMLLVEQLRLLENNLGRAVQEAFAEDVARLEVQGRFLSERFARMPS